VPRQFFDLSRGKGCGSALEMIMSGENSTGKIPRYEKRIPLAQGVNDPGTPSLGWSNTARPGAETTPESGGGSAELWSRLDARWQREDGEPILVIPTRGCYCVAEISGPTERSTFSVIQEELQQREVLHKWNNDDRRLKEKGM